MPRTPRHLFSGLIWVLAAFVCLVTAGDSVAQTKGAPLQKPAAPEVVLPSAETTVILIRTTLLSLNDALRTGNYTVLRDIASPSFREANNAGRLYEIFSNLAGKNINLSAVALLVPQVPQAPSIDQNKRLHISGYFPGNPIQLNFDLIFEAVNDQWRLFGIAVNPTSSTTANPEAPASPKNPPPPKGKTGK